MPVYNQKANSRQNSQAKLTKTLHADAKEFVPSHIQPEVLVSERNPSIAHKGDGNNIKPTAAKFNNVESTVSNAKAPAPGKVAWRSAPSQAVMTAATIPLQSTSAVQKQPHQIQGMQKSQQKHQQKNRGDDKIGAWKKAHNTGEKDHQHHPTGVGHKKSEIVQHANASSANAGSSGGVGVTQSETTSSWARTTTKPGVVQAKSGHHRQNHLRGSNGNMQEDHVNNSSRVKRKAQPLELLKPGEGKTDSEKAVKRITIEFFLAMRMNNVDRPKSWAGEGTKKIPDECLLNVPFLEYAKPLQINEETRWKSKVFMGKDGTTEGDENENEATKKALLILNKLSLTKFEKLSDDFINCGIGRNVECLTEAVSLIVNKAQDEQHFSSMYARLCLKLSNTTFDAIDDGGKKGKVFKMILRERCQIEFETETSVKIEEATKDITNEEEIEYHANLIKMHYLGHMRFIGELYKLELISIKIMLFCLKLLLEVEESPSDKGITNEKVMSSVIQEEKFECFAKLMTVIGSSLEQQSNSMKRIGKADAASDLKSCWEKVEVIVSKREDFGPKVSNRIKFMLQNLLDLKQNGWVTRRKEEDPKTLEQIHNEVASDERERRISSNSIHGIAQGKLRRGYSSSAIAKAQVDKDGFLPVRGPLRRGLSTGNVHMPETIPSKTTSEKDVFMSVPSKVARRASISTIQRRQSESILEVSALIKPEFEVKGYILEDSSHQNASSTKSGNEHKETCDSNTQGYCLSADECGEKVVNILKEYFVGGDTDDAVLSINELVRSSDEGFIERAAKVIESAILMVLESKQENIEKFITVFLRFAKENRISGKAFVLGLNAPLKFLHDITIDAPHAKYYLAKIIAEFVKAKVIAFEFLLNAPEYFRKDQHAASFGAKVLKSIGDDALSSYEFKKVIEQLMTDEDKKVWECAADLIAAA